MCVISATPCPQMYLFICVLSEVRKQHQTSSVLYLLNPLYWITDWVRVLNYFLTQGGEITEKVFQNQLVGWKSVQNMCRKKTLKSS